MLVYRITKAKYGGDLIGEGGKKGFGRWHYKGHAIIYTADSIASATLELLVHTPITRLPKKQVLVCIDIPKRIKIKKIDINTLPKDWDHYMSVESTRIIGNEWLESYETAVMSVPSAITRGSESNYLINPQHPDAKYIKVIEIKPYVFDKRLGL